MNPLAQLLLLTALSLASFAPEVLAGAGGSKPHIDLAPIHVHRLRVRNDHNSTALEGPSTFAKVPRRKRTLEERATKGNPKGASFYSAVVAVGASYTDNGHPRSSQYSGSLRQYYPYNKYGGKYTNGKVAVEYMVDSSVSPSLKSNRGNNLVLQDYAYGGSVVQNGLGGTGANSPAAVDQISTYLSDLGSGSFSPGNGRVLHYFNSGINPVSQIWNNAMSNGFSSSAKANAVSAVAANIQAYTNSIQSIANSKSVKTKIAAADFVVVGIPPLEIVPTFAHQVSSSVSKSDALAFLKQLSDQYNAGLRKFSSTFNTQYRNNRVYYYDLASLWYSMNSSPRSYGLSASPITQACYNSSTGGICSKPDTYLYWDTLHPTTAVMKIMAQKINALVLGM
ncbi:uncharacterized protein JCM15063_005200 [Sporobolomyces koalae]|uniref:uncharacterized protein n=1 Tax=Sporobolomyces koalae TaxID=500713 RepID=UPI00317686EA